MNHLPDVTTMENAPLEIDSNTLPREDDNLRMGLETTQCNAGKKKKKKRGRKRKSMKSKDIDNNHPKDTSVNINPIKIDSVLHPPVTACLSMDLEITQHNVEVISSQNLDNGKKLNGSHDALISNDTNQDFQEGGLHPSCYLTDIDFVEREDANSVSTKKHDDVGEVDINSSDMSSIKTCLRKERVTRHRRNRRKLSKSRESRLESIKENDSHSVLVVQDNSMRDTSLDHSDEVVVSSEQGMGQVVTGYGASLLVARDCSLKQSSGECSDGEPASVEPEENIKMENLEGSINKKSLVKDASEVDLREIFLEKGNRDKLDVTQNVVMDASAEDNFHKSTTFDEDKTCDHSYSCDPSIMNIESDKFDKQPELKDAIPSSSQLGGMAYYDCEVTQAVITKEGPQPRLHSSPKGAPPGRKKLLVLDVNGLLADIVPYVDVSERYKPDTFISTKAVFKRPFCDDFLQFCFERFHVGVWSSRTKRNVESVLDFLMGQSKYNLLFRWDQSHCTDTGFNTVENRDKPWLLKELKKLWEKHEPGLQWKRGDYNESNTLLLDDSPYKALRNPPHTAIFPHTFQYKDVKDNSLGPSGDLRVYLEGLALADNVQKYVELNPFGQRPITKTNLSWAFYLKVIGTTS